MMTRAKKRFGCRQGKNGATRNQECPLARKSCRAALFASPWNEGKTKEESPETTKLCVELDCVSLNQGKSKSEVDGNIAIISVKTGTNEKACSARKKRREKVAKAPPSAAKLEMKTPKTEEAENTEEVVKDSQEMYAFPITEVKQSDDFDSKMDMVFSLYERYSGERCQLPERTSCPLRDGWYQVHTVVQVYIPRN